MMRNRIPKKRYWVIELIGVALITIVVIKFTRNNTSQFTGPVSQGEPLPDALISDLEKYVKNTMWENDVPGVSMVLVQGDQVVYAKGIGVRDLENKEPVTTETLMGIGSSTKTMTAVMIGSLVDDGIISWDTPVTDVLPSFAYPPALIQDFESEEEISQLLHHIAETYLSTKYQKSRDWRSFIKKNATAASITCWMAELSETYGMHVQNHIGPTSIGKPTTELQHLFSEEDPNEEEIYAFENLAKQVVDSLLSICMEVFPNLLEAVGFPATMEILARITPYELAVMIFNRWSTEGELYDDLPEQFQTVLGEPMQDYFRFCVRAILYRLNIIINPKYKRLFVAVGLEN